MSRNKIQRLITIVTHLKLIFISIISHLQVQQKEQSILQLIMEFDLIVKQALGKRYSDYPILKILPQDSQYLFCQAEESQNQRTIYTLLLMKLAAAKEKLLPSIFHQYSPLLNMLRSYSFLQLMDCQACSVREIAKFTIGYQQNFPQNFPNVQFNQDQMLNIPSGFVAMKQDFLKVVQNIKSIPESYEQISLRLTLKFQVWEGHSIFKPSIQNNSDSQETYFSEQIKKLPYFIGEYSQKCPKQLNLVHQMGEATCGMHLCLNLQNGSMPITNLNQLMKDTHLVFSNYSYNGWSLRMKLGPGRKWLIENDLIVEIDQQIGEMPIFKKKKNQKEGEESKSETEQQDNQQDYSRYLVVRIGLTTNPEQYNSSLAPEQEERLFYGNKLSGTFHQWSVVLVLSIVLVDFQTNQILGKLRPGDYWGTLRIAVFNKQTNQDVTESFLNHRELEDQDTQEEYKGENQQGEWEIVFVNDNKPYQSRSVSVWARDVVSFSRKAKEKIQNFPTYFEVNTDYREDLSNAPVKQVTQFDELSFGNFKFYIQLEGNTSQLSQSNCDSKPTTDPRD